MSQALHRPSLTVSLVPPTEKHARYRFVRPCLPQDDPHPSARQADVSRARAACGYNFNVMPPLAIASTVPPDQQPSLAWLAEVAEAMLTLQVGPSEDRGRPGEILAHPRRASRAFKSASRAAR